MFLCLKNKNVYYGTTNSTQRPQQTGIPTHAHLRAYSQPYHDESFRLWTVSIRTYREKENAPTEEDVKRLEEAVNAVIAQGLDVTTEFITQEEAQGRFDLKRLPEDASETVRIVKVGNYDECLCLGTHVKNTSEVGTFKVISHDWNEEAKRWRMRFKLQ